MPSSDSADTDFSILKQSIAALPLRDAIVELFRKTTGNSQLRKSFHRWLLALELTPDLLDNNDFPVIGDFTLLHLLGRGSSSLVYLARQSSLQRLVAIKLLNQHTDELGKRRFLREADYLAALQHPGIASIYAVGEHQFAGQTGSYIAMEYVDGLVLNDFLQSTQPSIQTRVQLIIDIGEALFHAHQRGIIHRDIKPENILVTPDGKPHIVDFGIGHALHSRSELETRLTQHAQFIGTLAYMSPEQLEGKQNTADIPLDIYSLGIVAFETLSGSTAMSLEGLSVPQAIERILEHKLKRLSVLQPEVDRDLENIIARATTRDSVHRYLSVSAFTQDLKNWLTGEPILNCGLTSTYHLKQVIRRNKLALSVATAFVIAILIGSGIASMFAIKEAAARKIAEQQANRADRVNEILTGLLKSADPEQGKGRELTVLEVVNNARPTVSEVSRTNPEVGIELSITLADVLRNLGELEQAQQLLDDTATVLQQADSPDAALSHAVVQAALQRMEGKLESALLTLDKVKILADKLEKNDTNRLAYLSEISAVKLKLGQPEAEILLQEILQQADQTNIQMQELRLVAMHNLATLKRQTGNLPEAQQLAEQVVAERSAFYGDQHPMTLYSLNTLGSIYSQSGDHSRAQAIYEQVLEHRQNIYGPYHPLTLNIRINILNALISQGKLSESDHYSQILVAEIEANNGTELDQRLMILNMRAYLLEDMGRLEDAENIYRQTLDLLANIENEKFVQHFAIGNNLGMLLMKMQRKREASEEFKKVLREMEAQGAEDHYIHAIIENNLGECLTDLGDYKSALKYLLTSHDILVARFGADHRRVSQSSARIRKLRSAMN